MPTFNEDQILKATVAGQAPANEPTETGQVPEETGFMDAASAFFQLENPVFSATKDLFAPEVSQEFDPEFKPFDKLQEDRPDLLRHASKFYDVDNEEQYNKKIFNIEREEELKAQFASAPTMTKIAAGLVSSVVDPLILIPYAGIAKTANTVARVGKGITSGIGVGAVSSIAREGVLQATQETRTVDESIVNILAETALGGLIGGGAAALSNPVKSASQKVLAKAIAGDDFKVEVTDAGTAQLVRESDSVGAAARTDELEDLGLAHINERLAKMVSGPDALKAPDLRAILSPSGATRKLGEVFYNSNFIRKKNVEGISSVENAQNMIFRREQGTLKTLKEAEDLYLDYTGKGIIGSTLLRPKNMISSRQFSERMWKSLTDENYVDEIVQVQKAAKVLRSDMDRMAKELQAAKILPEELDAKFMRNYMTRIYDVNKLHAPSAQGRFINRVKNWVKKHNKDGSVRSVMLDDDAAEEIATTSLSKIRGETDQQIAMSSISEGFVSKGKFLKERQLMVPDSEIQEFLMKDSMRLYKNYMTRATKLLETKKALERAGFDSIVDVIEQIKTEASLATRGLDGEEAIKVGKKFKEQEDLVNMMYRSMLGQLRKPGKGDRLAETLLNYQFVRLLGGVTISSLPELAMPIFRKGLLGTLRDGYLPMLRSMKTSKLTKNQLNDITGALEFENANILRAMSSVDDIDNIGRNQTPWDTTQELLVNSFVKATYIGRWTSMNRRLAAQVSSADLVRTLKRGPKGKEVEYLASLGIGEADYGKILSQIDTHVQGYKGSFVINPHLWTDKQALSKMQNAIQTEVESIILKPGVESTPFFVQKNQWAKVLFQFKSFMSAATGKISISGLQRRDMNTLTGMVALIGAGAMTGMARDLIAGKDISDDPIQVTLDGMDRSGLTGLLGTTVVSTAKTFYDEKTRRYGGKSVSSNILGPSASQIEELTRSLAGVVDGEITENDTKALMRMIPFMNLFYIKGLTDRAFGRKE